jgi:hypothetical protein
MRTVNSFKCSYCGKLYESKDSCRSHENRCYFNPKTRSCASCAFLKYDSYEYKTGHTCSVRTCIKNHNVTVKLKTKCEDYFFKNALGSVGKIEQAEINYNPIPKVKKYLKSIGLAVETNLKIISDPVIENSIYDDEYFSLVADAYLDKLISAVGFKILSLAVEEFSNTHDLLTVQELNMHYNLQNEEIYEVINGLSSIGIPDDTVYNLINNIAGQLPKTLVYAYPLIKQSEVSYYRHMVEAYEWIGDEGSAKYFENMAIKADKMPGIESCLDMFSDIKPKSFPKEEISELDKNCLKIIEETFPDLKSTIICRLCKKRNAECQILSDTPF